MKCPQCGLNNLEHIKVCVKCGNLLVGGSLPEDFTPEAPRAGCLNLIKKLFWKWRRSRRVILPEKAFKAELPSWRSPTTAFFYGEPVPGSLLAMLFSFILPGTGQFFMRRQIRGTIFLIPSLIALLTFFIALSNYSIDAVNLSANTYLVFQCMAVFDAMPRIRAIQISDWGVNIVLALMVWVCCFAAINTTITFTTDYAWEGARLRTLMYNYPEGCAIQLGDTMLFQQQDTYARGDIIMYTYTAPAFYNNSVRWNNIAGIDKVVGLPGETASVRNGIILINSVALENQEELTVMTVKIPNMEWTLGKNEYFVITSNLPARFSKVLGGNRKATVLNVTQITARAVRIVSPFSRIRNL